MHRRRQVHLQVRNQLEDAAAGIEDRCSSGGPHWARGRLHARQHRRQSSLEPRLHQVALGRNRGVVALHLEGSCIHGHTREAEDRCLRTEYANALLQ
eukprot:7013367-Alexandrium_andersonii.AAC.1